MAIVKDLGMVTAYAYAVAGGYEGTEAEFEEMLGQAGITLEQLENLTAVATTLSEGSEATASYSDGVLTFGIPRGNTGAKGNKGDKGDKGDTGNGIASIVKTGTSGLVDTYTITFTDGTTTTFEVTNGADGDITNVAQAFDATKAYSVGDIVLYQGTLYAFTAAHAAGAWVGSDAQAVILADEVTELKDDLTQTNERMDAIAVVEKNLLPVGKTEYTFNNVASVYEDGIFTMSGTANASGGRLGKRATVTLNPGTYVFSMTIVSGTGVTLLVSKSGGTSLGGFNYANPLVVTLTETDELTIGFNTSNNVTYNVTAQIQCEKGSTPSTFEKPSTVTAIDRVARADIENIISIIEGLSSEEVEVVKSGNLLTINSTFNDEPMALTVYVTQSDTDNPCFDFGSYSGSFVKSATDDICPVFYNGSYRCAGHGNNVVQQVTAALHGLTVADIGKVWSADGLNWVLVKIVDANTLWFISEPNAASTRPFSTGLSASGTLTGTPNITFTAKKTVQLKPQNINRSYHILLDGDLITDDGTYTGGCLKLVETYQSLDCIKMVTYLKANVGNNDNTSYYNNSIGGELQYTVTYSFYGNGSCTVSESITALRDYIDLSNFGVVQAIKYADNAYVPFTNYDEITELPSTTVTFTPDLWEDASFPPYKYYEIDTTSGIGFALVYDISFGAGKPAFRTQNLSNAGNFNGTSHKMYPNFVGKGTVVNVGENFGANACRIPVKIVNNGIGYYWHSGDAIIVEIEAFTATTVNVEIPKECIGKNIAVVKTSDNIKIIDSVCANDELSIVSIGAGSATLKIE